MAKWIIFTLGIVLFSGCSKYVDLSYTKPPPILKQSKKIDISVIGDNKELLPALISEMRSYNRSNGEYFRFGNDIKISVSAQLKRYNNSRTEQTGKPFCSDYYWNGSMDVCLKTQNLMRRCVTANAVETATVNVLDRDTSETYSFNVDGSNSQTVCTQSYAPASNRYILASNNIKGAYYEFDGKQYVLFRSYNWYDSHPQDNLRIVEPNAPTEQIVSKIISNLTPSIERYSVILVSEPEDTWSKDMKNMFDDMIDALDDQQYTKAQELISHLERAPSLRHSFPILYNKAVLAEADGRYEDALAGYESAGKSSAVMKNILQCVDSVARIKMLQKNRIQQGKARE